MKLLLFIFLFYSTSQAATIKQLLNDQNLAVLELGKNENVASGDTFIAADKRNQCLIEVLSIKEKLVTVSTKQCSDKSFLTVGKKVDKSLIDPAALMLKKLDQAPPPVEEKLPKKAGETVDYQTVPEKKKPELKKFAPNELNFWPYSGQVVGATAISSSNVTIKNDSSNLSSDSSSTLLSQGLGVGITHNFAAGLVLYDLASANNGAKTGIQSPVIEINVHSNQNETNQIISAGFGLCPNGSDDNYLRDNFQTFIFSYGMNYDLSRLKSTLLFASYAESSNVKSQTLTQIAISYANYFSRDIFINIGASASNYSDEEMRFTNLKFKYATLPRITLAVGGNSASKSLSWQVTADYFSTKVVADSTVDTNLTYSGSSVGLTIGYLF